MPIRINLKELFPADSQEISVDKINFNFNKLLALGVGEQGIPGITGPIGPAGPTGLTGATGLRGATWYVGSGAPTLVPANGILPGDLYLDGLNFNVWSWDGVSWTQVVSISSIINSYISAGPTPFVRGLGIGSPDDDRFILFNRRGNTLGDITTDTDLGAVSNSANNDILFLNNFNEDVLNTLLPFPGFEYGPAVGATGNQVETEKLFNSLLAVSVDHRLTTGRYHVELGSLFDDGGNIRISEVDENFKMRYTVETGPHSFGANYGNHYTKTLFSLDRPFQLGAGRASNSVFQFDSAKKNGDDTISLYMGSRYGFDEALGGTAGKHLADGIVFLNPGAVYANIGILQNYTLPNLPTSTGYVDNAPSTYDYFLIDSDSSLKAVLVNKPLYQNNGNIIQLGTTTPRTVKSLVPSKAAPTQSTYLGKTGIYSIGNELYTASGSVANFLSIAALQVPGYFNKFIIEDPNNPLTKFNAVYSEFESAKLITSPAGAPIACPETYDVVPSNNIFTNYPIGTAVSDLTGSGKYLYAVNNLDASANGPSSGFSGDEVRSYFQILEKDSVNDIGLRLISRLGQDYDLTRQSGLKGSFFAGTLEDPLEVNAAYRVKLYGKYAIVATNALENGSGPTSLGTVDGLYSYSGVLTAIDISDPTDPVIVASTAFSTSYSPRSASTLSGAILDIEIVDSKVYALVWEQTLTAPGTVNIRIDVFDISTLNDSTVTSGSILWIGRSTPGATSSFLFNQAVADQTAWDSLFKFGAIDANQNYMYAGWNTTIKIFDLNDSTNATVSGACIEYYPQKVSFNIPNGKIFDLKHIGNSLYVLATDTNTFTTYVYKYEISGTGSTLNTQLVYTKTITSTVSYRFTIVGKHIYLATNTGVSTSSSTALIALDFDGLYTGGAHIESLRADKADIFGDLNVSGEVKANAGLEVGVSAMVHENLTVGKNLNIIDDVTVADGDINVTNGSITLTQGNIATLSGDVVTNDLVALGTIVGIGDLDIFGTSTLHGPATINDDLVVDGQTSTRSLEISSTGTGTNLTKIICGSVQVSQAGAHAISKGSTYLQIGTGSTSGNVPTVVIDFKAGYTMPSSNYSIFLTWSNSVNYYQWRHSAEVISASSFKITVAYDVADNTWSDNNWTGSVTVDFMAVAFDN